VHPLRRGGDADLARLSGLSDSASYCCFHCQFSAKGALPNPAQRTQTETDEGRMLGTTAWFQAQLPPQPGIMSGSPAHARLLVPSLREKEHG